MIVRAKLLSTEGPYLEAKLFVDGVVFSVMDCLSESSMCEIAPGDELQVDLKIGLADEQESWSSMFNGNPEKKEFLEAIYGWKYKVYGKVVGFAPVLIQCGAWTFEAPFETHDSKVVGEFLAFTIKRLDASLVEK